LRKYRNGKGSAGFVTAGVSDAANWQSSHLRHLEQALSPTTEAGGNDN